MSSSKYLDLNGLEHYDVKIKELIDERVSSIEINGVLLRAIDNGDGTQSWEITDGNLLSSEYILGNYYTKSESNVSLYGKYDKTGGRISGDVEIGTSLNLISEEDEDYKDYVKVSSTDGTWGPEINLESKQESEGNATVTTTTRVTGVATPRANTDATNKQYVDSVAKTPIFYSITLKDDKTIENAPTSATYSLLSEKIGSQYEVYLKVWYKDGYFICTADEFHSEVDKTIRFSGLCTLGNELFIPTITVNDSNVWTIADRIVTGDINVDSTHLQIPTAKSVYDNITHADELLYEAGSGLKVDGVVNTTYTEDGTVTGSLKTTGSSGSWSAWNITGMSLSKYRAIRFICIRDNDTIGGTWTCDVPMNYAIQKTTDNPDGFYVSSGQMASFGDRNRWVIAQCGVKGDKTAIGIGQVFSLYGTAATTVSEIRIVAVYGIY